MNYLDKKNTSSPSLNQDTCANYHKYNCSPANNSSRNKRYRGAMNWFERTMYSLLTSMGQFIRLTCFRINMTDLQIANREGGYILAVTHMGNIEPAIASCLLKRKIRWMARQEFFRPLWARAILRCCASFPVNRSGVPVSAVRTSINAVNAGEVVGIFPEGEVKKGKEAVIHGATLKRGACVISQRTGAPVLPIVILGTTKLSKVSPWLPFKNAKISVSIGQPIKPNNKLPRRAGRFEMAKRLENGFVATYKKLLKADKGAEQFYQPETIP